MAGGGAGVIFDAIRKMKENRNLRYSNRSKFNGNYSEDALLKSGEREKIEFPKLPKEQVKAERERIRVRNLKRKKNRIWILSVALVLLLIAMSILWVETQGFEYWDFLEYD